MLIFLSTNQKTTGRAGYFKVYIPIQKKKNVYRSQKFGVLQEDRKCYSQDYDARHKRWRLTSGHFCACAATLPCEPMTLNLLLYVPSSCTVRVACEYRVYYILCEYSVYVKQIVRVQI
jgi:hypothetical protein